MTWVHWRRSRFALIAGVVTMFAAALVGGSPAAARSSRSTAAPTTTGQTHCFDAVRSGAWTCVDSFNNNGTEYSYGSPAFNLALAGLAPTAPAPLAGSTTHWTFSATVYYGQGSTNIGSDQESAGVNLNGRQSQMSMSLVRLSGPTLKPTLDWLCNGGCGSGTATSAGYVGSYSLPAGQSGYSTFNGSYYDQFDWSFHALGWAPYFHNPTIDSNIFTCFAFGTPVCQFS